MKNMKKISKRPENLSIQAKEMNCFFRFLFMSPMPFMVKIFSSYDTCTN